MFHRHVQHIGDVVIAKANLQCFAIETLAVAHIAWHIDIRQELHFDSQFALSLTSLASPAMHIERKTSGLVAAHFAFWQVRQTTFGFHRTCRYTFRDWSAACVQSEIDQCQSPYRDVRCPRCVDVRRLVCVRPSAWMPARCKARPSSMSTCRFLIRP